MDDDKVTRFRSGKDAWLLIFHTAKPHISYAQWLRFLMMNGYIISSMKTGSKHHPWLDNIDSSVQSVVDQVLGARDETTRC